MLNPLVEFRNPRPAVLLLAALILCTFDATAGEIPLAQDAPQPLSPAESAAQLRLPAGFRIELVASEPLISDPSCVTFDARGRLFVCELHGYNMESHIDVQELNKTGELDRQVRRVRWELEGGKIADEATKRQFGRVKLLHDTDGDGRMDRADMWAEGLPPCYGLVPVRDGVIVVCAPDIVFLADRDGDGQAEVRETLYSGFRNIYLERGINNPRQGPDNWIYVGAGGLGGTIEGPHLAAPTTIGDTDFRIRADGTAIEPVSGKVSTFGLALNDVGDRFLGRGGTPANYALPLGDSYLRRNPHVASPQAYYDASDYNRTFRISRPHPWRVKRRQDPAWIEFYGEGETNSAYYTAGCGVEFYHGSLFPQEYFGAFFCCEPSHNVVHRAIVHRDGAGYTARHAGQEQQAEFIASTDQWFRPINLRVGPDGALYIVDMYREIVEDYSAIPRFLQQQYQVINGNDRGRIWRLLPTATPPRKVADLSSWSGPQLVAALDDSDQWWRKTAQRLLIERGDRTVAPQLVEFVRTGNSDEGRMLALYALDANSGLHPADVAGALDDASYIVRLHGLQLAGRWLDANPQLLGRVLAMTGDPDSRVRLQLAMTLGAADDSRATEALLELVRHHGDERWMDAAVLSSARKSAGELLTQILTDVDLRQRAESMLQRLAATVAAGRNSAELARVLELLVDQDQAVLLPCLEGLTDGLSRGAQPVDAPADGWASMKRLLNSPSYSVRRHGVHLGSQLGLDESPEMQVVYADAAERAVHTDFTIEQRQEAIEILQHAPYATLSPVTNMLLDVRQPPALQLAAIGVLAESDDPQVGPALLAAWKSYSPQLREAVLDVLGGRENHLPTLLNAVEQGEIRLGEINATRRQHLTCSRNAEIAARAEALFDRHRTDAELQARIEQYRAALEGMRDPSRGREVFEKNCLNCHKLRDKGHDVGPALGSAANKPDESILLEILDPSGDIAAGYGTYMIVTEDGRILNGILSSDSATSVSLRREKGEVDTILRTDIESMAASDLSLMPSDLHKTVSPADVASLISFLRQEFSGQKAAGD